MTSRSLVGWLLIILAGASTALAVGEAAAPSLIISPSARAWGLGQSYVAVADDATAIYWNPGGLGFLEGTQVSLTHSQLVPMLAPDVYFESINVCKAVEPLGTFGLNIIYLTYGSWWETTHGGQRVAEHESYEFALGGYYSTRIGPNSGLGVGIKVVHEFLAPAIEGTGFREASGWSFAVDLGILDRINDRFSFGVALQNIGPEISFVEKEESAPLPRTLRFGVAFVPARSEGFSTLVSLELTKALFGLNEIYKGKWSRVTRDATLNGGIELSLADFVAPRLGYIYDPTGEIKGFTFGFGVQVDVPVLGKRVRLDYASVPKALDLGREDKWSLTVTQAYK